MKPSYFLFTRRSLKTLSKPTDWIQPILDVSKMTRVFETESPINTCSSSHHLTTCTTVKTQAGSSLSQNALQVPTPCYNERWGVMLIQPGQSCVRLWQGEKHVLGFYKIKFHSYYIQTGTPSRLEMTANMPPLTDNAVLQYSLLWQNHKYHSNKLSLQGMQ